MWSGLAGRGPLAARYRLVVILGWRCGAHDPWKVHVSGLRVTSPRGQAMRLLLFRCRLRGGLPRRDHIRKVFGKALDSRMRCAEFDEALNCIGGVHGPLSLFLRYAGTA